MYTELPIAREPATITCVLAETQAEWKSNMLEKKGRLLVYPDCSCWQRDTSDVIG